MGKDRFINGAYLLRWWSNGKVFHYFGSLWISGLKIGFGHNEAGEFIQNLKSDGIFNVGNLYWWFV